LAYNSEEIPIQTNKNIYFFAEWNVYLYAWNSLNNKPAIFAFSPYTYHNLLCSSVREKFVSIIFCFIAHRDTGSEAKIKILAQKIVRIESTEPEAAKTDEKFRVSLKSPHMNWTGSKADD